jgi:hypothetical protein
MGCGRWWEEDGRDWKLTTQSGPAGMATSARYICFNANQRRTRDRHPMRANPFVVAMAFCLASMATASAENGPPPASGKHDKNQEDRSVRSKPADCHRDVRTHRINGVKITHRHVGDGCQVRTVRQAN